MKKIKDPYLAVINKYTKYNPEDFKDFEYEKIDVAMGDWGKKTALIEKKTAYAYQQANKELTALGAKCTLNSAGRSRFDQVYAKIEKFGSVLKHSKSIIKAAKDVKNQTAKIGYSEHLSNLSLDIKIETADITVPDKIKQRYPDKSLNELKFITKRAVMEKHGFILSYPQSNRLQQVTGIADYEPWHWRYVGAEHSKMIGKLREKVNKTLDSKEEIFLEDYVKLLEVDIKAGTEQELLEQYTNHFINNILNLEKTEELNI